jgi:hypothetical protein
MVGHYDKVAKTTSWVDALKHCEQQVASPRAAPQRRPEPASRESACARGPSTARTAPGRRRALACRFVNARARPQPGLTYARGRGRRLESSGHH